MNISELWQKMATEKTHYSQFDKQNFIDELTKNIPDWKEQVKNEELWPELHCYGNNVGESFFLSVILKEAGLKFAYYLIKTQWGKLHSDASQALQYCSKYISSNWMDFPDYVQEKILSFELYNFLNSCNQHPDIWMSLTQQQKNSVFQDAKDSENDTTHDMLIFLLWSKELNYKTSPYIRFKNDIFRHTADELKRNINNSNRDADELAAAHLKRWDFPVISTTPANEIHYEPSRKLVFLLQAAQTADDNEYALKIESLINDVRHIVEFAW